MGDADRVLEVNLQGWASEWGCKSPPGEAGNPYLLDLCGAGRC